MSNSGYNRGAQIPDVRSHARLNIVKLHLMFVGKENFFFMPSFGRLEFGDALLEFWKICIPLGYNIHGDCEGRSYKATEIIID